MSTRRPRIAGERRRPAESRPAESRPAESRPAESRPAESEALEIAAPEPPENEPPEIEEDAERAARPPLARRARVLLASLCAAAVVGVGFAVVSTVGVQRAESDAIAQVDAEDAATSAASAALEQMLSYRYETVSADLEDAESLMTDEFAAEYAELAPQVSSAAEQRKIDVSATVREIAALECGQECSRTSVRLLAFVDQHRTLDGEPGSPAALSAVVRMEQVDGDWLVAEMTTS